VRCTCRCPLKPLQRARALQATELVGRDSEMQQLTNGLAQASDGQGCAFVIGGESGIGKSRLVSELRTQALARGFWGVEGQSVTEGGLYLQEVLPLMRALCIRSELADAEASLLKPFVPDIAALLGREVSDPFLTNTEEVQKRLFGLLRQLLGRVKKPLLLLLLEDLHWTRRETLAWMEHLLQELSGFPLLLVGTFRSDECPDLPSRFPAARYLLLPRLGSEEISRLSESILGAAGQDPTLISYLQGQTEGNVFFLVEIMRALAENAGGTAADPPGGAARARADRRHRTHCRPTARAGAGSLRSGAGAGGDVWSEAESRAFRTCVSLARSAELPSGLRQRGGAGEPRE